LLEWERGYFLLFSPWVNTSFSEECSVAADTRVALAVRSAQGWGVHDWNTHMDWKLNRRTPGGFAGGLVT